MTSEIVFHDLTSQKWPCSWSPYTLRTTLCLNYLELPYKHDEISYPDIANTLSSLGVKPPPEVADKAIKFTLPAISIANETTMGSTAIAEKLASLKPEYEKKLFPQGQKSRDVLKKFEDEVLGQVNKAMGGMPKHVIAFVPLFLDERGSEYFYATREPRLVKMNTNHRSAVKDKREEEKPETQVGAMKSSPSAVAPQEVNEEEEQRKRNERYMALLEEDKAWKETLSILQSAEPLPATNIHKVMKMRQNMKGALAAVEELPQLATSLERKYNDGGRMASRLRQSAKELDTAVAAGDNERAILVNLNKLPESNFLREAYLSSFYKSTQKNPGDGFEEKTKEFLNRKAELRQQAEQKIQAIEENIKVKQQQELQRQGEGA
ncbi:hypothetical protein KCU65_g1735, partial [Aureobasidium melanogenum]